MEYYTLHNTIVLTYPSYREMYLLYFETEMASVGRRNLNFVGYLPRK